MITKTKRIVAGLLLAGLITTQAQASWLSSSWNTMRNGFKPALSMAKNGLTSALSATKKVLPYIFVTCVAAPMISYTVFKAAKHLRNRYKSVPFQMPELDDAFDDEQPLQESISDGPAKGAETTVGDATMRASQDTAARLERVAQQQAEIFNRL